MKVNKQVAYDIIDLALSKRDGLCYHCGNVLGTNIWCKLCQTHKYGEENKEKTKPEASGVEKVDGM